MDTYKQICAKLVEAWDDTADEEYDDFGRAASYLVAWARKALAEPEPEGPTDEELIHLAIDTRLYRFQATAGDPIQYEMTEQQINAFARAVLARWGNYPGSPDSSTQQP